MPRGGESLLSKLGPERVRGVEPGDVLEIAGAQITVLPATHEGRRGPQSKAVGPALGFRVDAADRSFWFPGDTELREDMADVGHVDLALVPIGGWGPTLEDGHMDPVAGAAAVELVGATTVVPVHWGTFWPVGMKSMNRANHELLFRSPGRRFVEAMAGSDIAVLLAPHGERIAASAEPQPRDQGVVVAVQAAQHPVPGEPHPAVGVRLPVRPDVVDLPAVLRERRRDVAAEALVRRHRLVAQRLARAALRPVSRVGAGVEVEVAGADHPAAGRVPPGPGEPVRAGRGRGTRSSSRSSGPGWSRSSIAHGRWVLMTVSRRPVARCSRVTIATSRLANG